MIVPNGNDNNNWQNARIADLDNEPAFQPLERQFAHDWIDDNNDNWQNARIADNEPLRVWRQHGQDAGPHPLDGLPWDHPDVQDELDREAAENEAAQELYEPQNLDVDYTIPAGDDEDCDPRIEHVPALSMLHGDQLCEITPDGMHIIFHKKNDGNKTEATIEFPEGFNGRKCRFFDAAGTLCVMAIEEDGLNTLIYDFWSNEILGGGSMPEAIDWNRDILRKVVLIEGEGLQVVVTSDADGIRHIKIGI